MDLYECRILAQLDKMSSTSLLSLPTTDTWTPDHFLSEAKTSCESGSQYLKVASEKVEESIKDLVVLFQSSASLPTLHAFDTEESGKSKRGTHVVYNYSS